MSGSSGGSTTQVINPSPPPAPSTADAIREYVASLPALFEAQLKYAPQEAAQQVQLAQQYAVPLAQAYQQAQEVLYPGTSGLQEQLAGLAKEGSTGQVPSYMRDQYKSDLLGQLGSNASSGIGADYVSRNLLNQQQQYQQYYQNLGLSLAGRQPLVNPQSPGYTNQMGNYSPGQGLQYTQGNYGVFAGASRPIVSQNQSGTPNWLLGGQSALGAIGAAGGMGAMFCWVASELYGGWYEPRTVIARLFIQEKMPLWFKKFYADNGEKIAEYIKDKPILKLMLRPLFDTFVFFGRRMTYGTMVR